MKNRTLIALLAVLAVAACGGGSKKDTTTPTPTPDPVAADPNRLLTEAECNEVIDHVFAMPAAPEMAENIEAMKGQRVEMVKQCMTTATKTNYDCAMASQTWDDIGKCPEPGSQEEPATPAEPAEPAVD